ncbi:MAG: hypothetical protein FJW34_23595, partial [Acidobacteria bacterium]|nr:hypothetical protein [Acidobacteriota bacterium]
MSDKLRVETTWINLVNGVSQEEAPGLGRVGPGFRLPIGPEKGTMYILVESLRGPQPDVERQMVDTIAEAYRRAPVASITGALKQALTVANRQFYQANQAALSDQKIAVGTTCAVLRGADLFLAQAGPALAYMVHRGTLYRIPTDSPWLSQARVPITPISAPMGALLEIDPLFVHFFLEPGDLLLLCSSLLVRYAAEGEIRAAVTQGDSQTVVQALEQLAQGRDLVALAIAVTSEEAEAVPGSEEAAPGQGWQNVLREAIFYSPVEAPNIKIWRKHWWRLLEAIITPWILLTLTLSGIFVAYSLRPQTLWLLIPTLLAGLFWLAWQTVDWYNDIHVVTDDRIIEIKKKPFLWEVRREAQLTMIKDVRYIIPNQVARILGFGNVEIETVGQAGVFTFEAVPNPKSVQAEILNQLDRPRVGRADRASRVERARLNLLRLETLREIGLVREKLAWMPADQATLPGDTSEALRRLEAVGTEVAAALAPVSRRVRDGHLAAARRGLDDFRRFAAVGRGTRPFIEVA